MKSSLVKINLFNYCNNIIIFFYDILNFDLNNIIKNMDVNSTFV